MFDEYPSSVQRSISILGDNTVYVGFDFENGVKVTSM